MPVQLPQYTQDPYYEESQKQLSGLGSQLLEGKTPDAYSDIGTIGGQTFEDMMRGVTSDIQRGVTEQAATLGQRGGLPLKTAAREIGRVTPALRWQEMMRGIQGKQSLLGLGADITSGVRGAGLTSGGQQQSFGLATAQMGISQEQFQQSLSLNKEQFTTSLGEQKRQFTQELEFKRERGEITDAQFQQELALKEKQLQMQAQQWQEQKEAQEEQSKGSAWSNIIGGGIGALSNIYGMGLYGSSLPEGQKMEFNPFKWGG